MTLDELRLHLNATLLGASFSINRVSTDTRTLSEGDLFVALPGERFDGHDYVTEAEARGAVASVVERPVKSRGSLLQVANSRRALGQIAALNRSLFTAPLIAVTGSNGKTTVKELLRRIFLQQGPVLATQGNLNNDIGAPLTLLQLSPAHAAAVIELGASAPGEIAWTASLASPQVCIITNAGEAHMAGFGSYQGLIQAKGEIIDATPQSGTVVLNFDDPACPQWRARAGSRTVVTVSALGNAAADIHAGPISETPAGLHFDAHFASGGSMTVQLALIGMHNAGNALLAIAAAKALGLDSGNVARGLAAAEPVKGRMQTIQLQPGVAIIDDSYNANPTAMRAALRSLSGREGLRIAVLGDMAELGGDEAAQHQEIGRLAQDLGIDHLLTTGRYAGAYASGFGASTRQAPDHQQLVALLWDEICNRYKHSDQNSLTILVKGSRSAAMDQVVALLNKKVKS